MYIAIASYSRKPKIYCQLLAVMSSCHLRHTLFAENQHKYISKHLSRIAGPTRTICLMASRSTVGFDILPSPIHWCINVLQEYCKDHLRKTSHIFIAGLFHNQHIVRNKNKPSVTHK